MACQQVISKWDNYLQSGMANFMLRCAKSISMLSSAEGISESSIIGDFAPRQIRCNEDVSVMCEFIQLPDRSPLSTTNNYRDKTFNHLLPEQSIPKCKSGRVQIRSFSHFM